MWFIHFSCNLFVAVKRNTPLIVDSSLLKSYSLERNMYLLCDILQHIFQADVCILLQNRWASNGTDSVHYLSLFIQYQSRWALSLFIQYQSKNLPTSCWKNEINWKEVEAKRENFCTEALTNPGLGRGIIEMQESEFFNQ